MIRARGFTLLEMLAAMVLAAMLMIGVMAVIAGLGSHRPQRTTTHTDAPTISAVARLLGDDINQAVGMDTTVANQVMIEGYCGLDDRARGPSHRPVRVQYRIEQVDGRSWLVRRQWWLDELTNQNIQRELVCSDVTGFQVTPGVRMIGWSRSPSEQAVPSKVVRPFGPRRHNLVLQLHLQRGGAIPESADRLITIIWGGQS